MKFFYILQKEENCLAIDTSEDGSNEIVAQLENDGFSVMSNSFLANSTEDARQRWLEGTVINFGSPKQTTVQNYTECNSSISKTLKNTLLFPIKGLWNLVVIIGIIWLEIIWIGFLFGSVLGVILMLIFMPSGFLLPLGLGVFLVELWPSE